MSITALVNLAESLLNRASAQDPENPLAPDAAGNAARVTARPTSTLDQFVPSAQTETANATAEAAGLFTAAQLPLFTPAAESLLAQTAPAETNLANVAATANLAGAVVTSLAAAAPATPAGQNPAAVVPVSNDVNGNASGTIDSAGAAALTAAAPPPTANATLLGALAVQEQLQTLNNSLAALGLSATDIQKVDQVAGLINDFKPTAFTSLISQLESLAEKAAQQTTQGGNSNAGNGEAAAAQPTTLATSAAAPEALGANAANSGNFALQGLQLQLTFADINGQTVQAAALTAEIAPARAKAALA